MHETTAFGEWLRQRRKALDFTLDELGQRVGCSPATITKIESGVRRPSHEIAERLAAALAIPADERALFLRRARWVPSALPALAPSVHLPAAATLPTPITPLVGRAAELAGLVEQLQRGARLITLTGPPGVGKTRLAIAVAHAAADDFHDGVAFAGLATLHDPAQVVVTIAQALEVRLEGGQPALTLLSAALHPRRMLLVLDNFEQVIAAGPQVAQLLGACPGVQVLVTSRERMRVRGERLVRVPPLALASDDETIAQSPAVALFVETAQAASSDFRLSPANARTVATICARLDGLPLAIELVAAYCGTLPLAELLARLEDRFVLAGDGARDLPARQQTLRAALDWSYALLAPAEQRTLMQLGAFAGGWTLEAAEAVCDGDTPVLATLQALINKSLVQPEGTAGGLRFTLLETIRIYALTQLEAGGAIDATRERHAAYYLALAERAEPQLKGGEQQNWLEQLVYAQANIAAALTWLLAQSAAEQAGLFCGALRRFWWLTGRASEGRGWIERVLAQRHLLAPLTLAQVLIADGTLAQFQGDLCAAAAALESALLIGQQQEEDEVIGIATHNLGSIMLA